jgi:hypothetical protein
VGPNPQGGCQPKYRALKAGRERHPDEIRDRVARGIPFNEPDAASRGLPDPIILGMGYGRVEKTTAHHRAVQLPADLSIPTFLDRRTKP